MNRLVIATGNQGKVLEIKEMLAGISVELKSLSDFDHLPEVDETGSTFAENAAIKAKAYAELTESKVLADDSGLEVPSLGGAPGIYSARFAGEGASDAENTAKLLKKLENADGNERRACFVCEMAIAEPSGKILFSANGALWGTVTRKAFGINGFGYDPIFVPDGFSQTLGQLAPEIKNKISHRSVALRQIIYFLGRL